MKYRYELSPKAYEDIRNVVSWLLERSPQGASAWSDALYTALHDVTLDPYTYSQPTHLRRLRMELRTFTFHTSQGRNYHLIFVVENDVVRILRVRSPGQSTVRGRDLS